LPRPYKVIGYPILPVFYLVSALLVMIGQICKQPTYAGFGLLIILSGLPIYAYWHFKSKAASQSAQG
jgi:APA family basic amino acid/polyamine antiporter